MNNKIMLNSISLLKKPIIIGISGFGGSGKSTLANDLTLQLKAICIGIDSFYKPVNSVNYQLWNIFDFTRLEREVLKPFISGKSNISYGEFNWKENRILRKTIKVTNRILIIEGVGLFRPELNNYFSYSIWIDCPIEVAIQRGKNRDKKEYGINQDKNWDGIWRKNDLQCFKEFSPKTIVDCIIDCPK